MFSTTRGRKLAAVALSLGILASSGANGALAATQVTIDGCVLQRKPTSALMQTVDNSLFELDLRTMSNQTFSLNVDDCFVIVGADRGSEAGLRREFPQASRLIEAISIQDDANHINRGSHSSNQDEE